MKYTNLFISLLFSLILILSANSALASDPVDYSKLQYPITELGGCATKDECETFCSQSGNMSACISYGEKNGLLSGEEAKIARIVVQKIAKGETPGGCKTKDECETFCKGKVDNIKQCVAFAEELDVLPKEELARAKNIIKALEKGAEMPGGCATKDECESYCTAGSHIDECLNFAEAAQILSVDEIKEARLVASYVKNGTTPGGCITKDSCKKYCDDSSHFDECITFAGNAGLISKKEAELAKKAGGSGPGGCKSQKECDDYCNDISHYDECVSFGMIKDIFTEQEKERIENGVADIEEGLGSLPEDIRESTTQCLESSIGKDKFGKIMNKEEPITKEIGVKIDSCFAEAAVKIQEAMEKEMEKNIPSGIPAGASSSQGQGALNIDCGNFSAVPSCEYVPAGTARDACIQCKAK